MKDSKHLIQFSIKAQVTEYPSFVITNSKDGVDFLRSVMNDHIHISESFYVLFLNRANKVLGYSLVSQGGVSGTVVDVKIIAKLSVDAMASSIILAHNHPSGNREPSQADFDITKKVKNALGFLDIMVLDHLIITYLEYYSFADQGNI